jgi:hypothetical protein
MSSCILDCVSVVSVLLPTGEEICTYSLLGQQMLIILGYSTIILIHGHHVTSFSCAYMILILCMCMHVGIY